MSNPTEQPIDPDKMGVWCDVCEIEIIGYHNWEKHLESTQHITKLS